ncbi:Zinc finger HIT domain-containing protein 1 [Exaiptasia diaphana]|nr:Zinc finger HIT domain-containing protein 1 [Exaiptasia diaphana]
MEVIDRRESGRIKEVKRILDSATRRRRQQRQLEALEKDNTHEDPHGHINVLQAKARIPAFNDTMEEKKKKKKTKTGEHFKQVKKTKILMPKPYKHCQGQLREFVLNTDVMM